MARLRPIALALLLLAPGAAGAVEVRVTPTLEAGGGWASALFVGSDHPAHWQTRLSPGVGFDLSTGPVAKILTRYELGWSRYGTRAGALSHEAALALRLRLAPAFDLELHGQFDQLRFEEEASTGGTVRTPPAVATAGLQAGPLARWRIDRATTAELGLRVGRRENDLADDGAVGERTFEAGAALRHRFGATVEGSARARHGRIGSDDPLWASTGTGGQLAVGWAATESLLVQGHLGVQWNRFESRTDRYGWAGASLAVPVAEGATAELAWTFGDNRVVSGGDEVDRETFSGSRHLVWSGVRMELPLWL